MTTQMHIAHIQDSGAEEPTSNSFKAILQTLATMHAPLDERSTDEFVAAIFARGYVICPITRLTDRQLKGI